MPSGLEDTVTTLIAAYVIATLCWMVGGQEIERVRLGFFFNSLAHFFFLPAPLLFAFALVAGYAGLAIPLVIPMLVCASMWLPPYARPAFRRQRPVAGPTLRVATYNVLWVNLDTDAVVAAIRLLDADIVALQEVTPERAAGLEAALDAEYPHRLLYPRPKAYGIGLLSRLPLTASPDTIPDPDWIGDPAIATLTFDGLEVTVISLHAAPVNTAAAARERQARALAAYALDLNRPCIVMGDFNATPMNQSYRILNRGLRDAWLDAGRGLGHTFPGPAWSNARGDGLPRPLRRFVPRWLLRIDHVFVTRHWRAVAARVSPRHGGSDHRPVVADLTLHP